MSRRYAKTTSARAFLVSSAVVAAALTGSAPAWSAEPTPGSDPSAAPSASAEPDPAGDPSAQPTAEPSAQPTAEPSSAPSAQPSARPTPQSTGSTAAKPSTTAGKPMSRAERRAAALAADFGTGKVALDVSVAPLPGSSYPASPDLSGATVTVTVTDAFILQLDNPTEPITDQVTCTTAADGHCDEIDLIASPTATITVKQTAPPKGFLLSTPATIGTAGINCRAPVDPDVPITDCTAKFLDPGVYRTIGVSLTSSFSGSPLAGGQFRLCKPGVSPCSALDTGVTAADGKLLFDGLYLPASYRIEQTTAPSGYVVSGVKTLAVPAAASVAQAKVPVIQPFVDNPPPPTANDDGASTDQRKAVDIDVLANDDGHGAPLTISAVGDTPDGTTEIRGGQVRFTPDSGFHGDATFTYRVSTTGGTDTATVTVHVRAVAANRGDLPFTGANILAMVRTGLLSLLAGLLLVVGGRRRRPRASHA
ncbi:MAG: hypothetical protein QOJ92_527 [Frankiales bacterium]|nr:hypothetical protein [Frankiales bacterium]